MITSGTPAADVKFCLAFRREALSVPVMRRVLGDTLRGLGVDEDSVDDILLAATEACTNVLRHSGATPGYEVVASVGAAGCKVEVADKGRGFKSGRTWGAQTGQPTRPGHPPRVLAQSAGQSVGQSAALRRRSAGRSAVRSAGRGATRPAWASGPGPRGRSRDSACAVRAPSAREVAQLPESGRGLAVMRACVDKVTLRSSPGQGTVVTMQKRITLSDDSLLSRLRAAS